MTVIISGFPAVGKSYLFENKALKVSDSDSSKFSWIEPGVRHPDFPSNYIEHIKGLIGEVDIILVSSHDIVRKALEKNELAYTLVYPSIELKEEYIQRYKDRGNDEKFIQFISSNWDDFIKDLEAETFPAKLQLQKGQYLSDVLLQILKNTDRDSGCLIHFNVNLTI